MKKQITILCLLVISFTLISFTSNKDTVRPKSQFKGIIGDEISIAQLESLEALTLETDQENSNVISFRFVYAPKQGDAYMSASSGNKINENMLVRIKNSIAGDRILIDKVTAQYNNGLKTFCEPAMYTVIE